MKNKKGLSGCKAGINLGLWLSQNGGKSHARFAAFMTRDDIAWSGFPNNQKE